MKPNLQTVNKNKKFTKDDIQKYHFIGKGESFIRMLMIFAFVVSCILGSTAAQAGVSWEKTYGGSGYDEAWDIQQTADGGFVVAGFTESFGAGGRDAYVIKLTAMGSIDWEKTYGGIKNDEAWGIEQTADGGYIVGGYTCSSGAGQADAYIFKLDGSGNMLWQKTFGGTNNDDIWRIHSTSDGGYIAAGQTASYGEDFCSGQITSFGGSFCYVIKLDNSGNKIWEKMIGQPNTEHYASSIEEAADGGYFLSGYKNNINTFLSDIYVIKLNSGGNIDWEKTYGGSGFYLAWDACLTNDGGYAVAGTSNSFNEKKDEVYIIKLDGNGNKVWDMTDGLAGNEVPISIKSTTDGGYIVAGWSDSFGNQDYDGYILKLDGSGNVLWKNNYGSIGCDYFHSIHQEADGHYILSGSSNSYGGGDYDFYVINIDGQGRMAPYILSASPASASNFSTANILFECGNITQTTIFKLQMTGVPDIPGYNYEIINNSEIRCTFDLNGMTKGFYNIVVINPDGSTGSLPNAFEVTGHTTLISSITPNNSINNSPVTVTIIGENFNPVNASALLRKAGQPDIIGTDIVISESKSKVVCTFNINGAEPGYWDLVMGPAPFNATQDKGFKVYLPTDLGILKFGTRPSPGFNSTYYITYNNMGAPAENISVTDVLPPQVQYISADPLPSSAPAAGSSGTVVWNTPSMTGYTVTVKVPPPPEVNINDQLFSSVSISSTSNEPNLANNTYTYTQTVVGSYDPNDKGVAPQGYIKGDEKLYYVIQFENLGNAEAINIRIEDTLNDNLDDNTLSGISDNGVYDRTKRTISWQLENINLPPKGKGLVSFAINPTENLAPGTEINNSAAIYFDYNPPIQTPYAVNVIALPHVVALQGIMAKMRLLQQDIAYSGVSNGRSFLMKINTAISKVEDGMSFIKAEKNNKAVDVLNSARNELKALGNSIKAASSKKVPEEKRNAWTASVDNIRPSIEQVITELEKKEQDKEAESVKLAAEKYREAEDNGAPTKIFQNYPNPFNPSTWIEYFLGGDGPATVKLEVYNILGQEVVTLVNEEQSPGRYKILWEGKNNDGEGVASGVYYTRFQAGSYVDVMKMVILK